MINVIEEAKKVSDEVIEWRRTLHQTPELDDDLYITTEFVQGKLKEFGIPFRVVAKTGIVGLIEGEQDGGTIAIRADMDALPIVEENDVEYASKNENMHACGHDAHTAILLGTAKVLSENKHLIKGNVKLLFQPAEESFGGADTMLQEGAFENPIVDHVIGLHVGAGAEEGKIGIKTGPLMAAVDIFNIKVIGKGAHAATPNESIDPVLTAAEITLALQKIISRELSPHNPAVVTVAEIKAGSASNIIPEYAKIQGTVRTTSQEDREFIEERIHEICTHVAKANRATVEIDYLNHFPVLMNDEDFTLNFKESIIELLGQDKVHDIEHCQLGAEDMAYFLEAAPGTYFMLGTNNEERGIVYPEHHPKFNMDESVLWMGVAAFLETVFSWENY